VDLWRRHGASPKTGYEAEAQSVARLVCTPTSRNLVRVFFLQERMKGLGGRDIPTGGHVHVVGAGVMGGDIAAWCAQRGFTVTLQDRGEEFLRPALERAKAFYAGLGWTPTLEPGDVVFFQTGGSVLALWGRDRLAEDSGVEDPGGWGGVTLAHNVGSPEEVSRVIEEARAAGATISREPAETFLGGYSGVFVDPDGHPWEVPQPGSSSVGRKLTLPTA
jgi:catechol 2,3-dioxygenase-like lactoylglutathione lyase family enzyme